MDDAELQCCRALRKAMNIKGFVATFDMGNLS